jgi:hypothetical protein
MSRTLAQNGLGKARTLNGLSNDNIDTIKEKYDFDGNIESGTLLIGSSTGNYTANELTAGANITITNGTGQDAKGTITIASSQLVLNAGTNLGKTTSINGDITINLDAVIGGMTSVNGFTLVSNISSAANQFLLKDNSVGGFASGTFLTTNANGLIVPKTEASVITAVQNKIAGGNNITKNTASGIATLNLDATLTSITSINGYNANVLTVNNSNSQYLIKDVNLSADSILSVGSNNKISSTTPTTILSNLTAGNNLTKTGNTINLDANLTSMTSMISTASLRLVGYSNTTGQTTEISLNNSNIEVLVNNSNILKVQSTQVDINTKIGMNSNPINFGSATDTNHQILYSSSSMDGVLIRGFGINGVPFLRATCSDGDTPILECFKLKVIIHKLLGMEQQPINLYASTDTNHQILYSNDNSTMNGVLIRGFGNDVPFFRLQGTAGGTHNVLDAYIDKINLNRKIVIQPSTDIYTNDEYMLHIKPFQGKDCRVCIESDMSNSGGESHNPSLIFKQDGGGIKMEQGINSANQFYFFHPQSSATWSRFRFHCGSSATDSNGQPTDASLRLSIEKDQVIIYNSLVFNAGITDTASITYNNAKLLAVNIVEGGEFRIDNGSTGSNYFKTIAQGSGANGRTFFFEQGGDSGQSNGGAFQTQCGQGKMLFQSDRNLVIYRPDSTVSFASGGNASSRDYKKNIIDLVESDSINVIKNINPVSYEYKEQYWDSVDECDSCCCNVRKGFIWEDIKPILPQSAKSINMNNPDMETTKLLDTKEIIPDLVKTIQYLINKVETLEQQINK